VRPRHRPLPASARMASLGAHVAEGECGSGDGVQLRLQHRKRLPRRARKHPGVTACEVVLMSVLIPDYATRAAYRQEEAKRAEVAKISAETIQAVGPLAMRGAELARRGDWKGAMRLLELDTTARKAVAAREQMIVKATGSAVLKATESGDAGIADLIVSVTGNLDKQNDVIVPGAWQRAAADPSRVRGVVDHQHTA